MFFVFYFCCYSALFPLFYCHLYPRSLCGGLVGFACSVWWVLVPGLSSILICHMSCGRFCVLPCAVLLYFRRSCVVWVAFVGSDCHLFSAVVPCLCCVCYF